MNTVWIMLGITSVIVMCLIGDWFGLLLASPIIALFVLAAFCKWVSKK